MNINSTNKYIKTTAYSLSLRHRSHPNKNPKLFTSTCM